MKFNLWRSRNICVSNFNHYTAEATEQNQHCGGKTRSKGLKFEAKGLRQGPQVLGEGAYCPSPPARGLLGLGVENTAANPCNTVHFGVKMCILNNSMFNLAFDGSVWRHQVIKSWTLFVPLLKVALNLPTLLYGFRGPCLKTRLSFKEFLEWYILQPRSSPVTQITMLNHWRVMVYTSVYNYTLNILIQ